MLDHIGAEVISVRYPSGNTRINVKITGENGVTTDINGEGPLYDRDTIVNLTALIRERLTDGDTVVISGRPPLGAPADIYADLIKSFSACSGRLTSVRLPLVLTTPTRKNKTSSASPIALTAPLI